MPAAAEAGRGAARAWRAQRPPKPALDPFAEPGWLLDEERQPSGEKATSLTVFLLGRECPFTCVFCDLWQHTLDYDTPPGALPRQLELALAAARLEAGALPGAAPARLLKLYNASNFFEARAVPPVDDPALLGLARGFGKLVVESHAKLLGTRCLAWAEKLEGRLQVAIGFESAHPGVLEKIGKGIVARDLRRAAGFLAAAGIGLRAFVLIGAPFLGRAERPEWTRRTCELALELGAEQVVLIPLRPSPGKLEQLVASGEVALPDLEEVAETVDLCAPLAPARILLDGWDLARLATPGSGASLLARLVRFAAGDPA
jgi:archaeosine synthase beta-subunit